jgi:rhamnosyltransferase
MDAKMLTKDNICGCVILYRPTDAVYAHIQSYCYEIARLYVVDNTEREHYNHQLFHELSKLEGIQYISNFENQGIAHALNQAINIAQEEEYDFILTMDQDGALERNYITSMLRIVQKNNLDITTIGIIAPFQRVHGDIINNEKQGITDKIAVMTSGNLLNLHAVEQIGGFSEELFIDRVDQEYCLRLRMNNYRVIQVNSVVLDHPQGRMTKHFLFNRAYYTTNHSPIRRYYITRNTLYVIKKYGEIFPEYVKWEKDIFLSDLKNIILFEKDKINKLRMIVRGYCDYRQRVYGMLSHDKQGSELPGHSG